jgi:hypothetical protein
MLKQIDSTHFTEFNNSINNSIGIKFPAKYLQEAKCFAYFKDGKIVAGFIIYPYRNTMKNFRTFKQIKNEVIYKHILQKMASIKILANAKSKHLAEYTGYFILDKSVGLKFTLSMITTVCLMSHKYFFISYSLHNKKLKHYYSNGNPTYITITDVIFDTIDDFGLTKTNYDVERIEVLTKIGIIKIFLWRTIKVLRKWMNGLLKNSIS